jgi:hypothetical protein
LAAILSGGFVAWVQPPSRVVLAHPDGEDGRPGVLDAGV